MKPILLHTEQLTVGYRKKALIPDITFPFKLGKFSRSLEQMALENRPS